MEDFARQLGVLMRKGLNASLFLSILLKKLTKKLAKSPDVADLLTFLERLISNVPMERHIPEILTAIFTQAHERPLDSVRGLISALDVQYPILLDQAVSAFLQKEEEEKKRLILSLMHGVPNSGLHSHVEGTNLTLLGAADAPDAQTRKTVCHRSLCCVLTAFYFRPWSV